MNEKEMRKDQRKASGQVIKNTVKKAAKEYQKKDEDKKKKCIKEGKHIMEKRLVRAGQPIPSKNPPACTNNLNFQQQQMP